MWQFFVLEFISELANSSTIAVFVGALMAGWFGFKQYRSQKIWEKIDERYFKEGIEKYISELQRIRRTLEHNFAYSLLVLKYYRDLNAEDFLKWFDLKKIKENNTLSSKMPSSLLIVSLILKNDHLSKLSTRLHAKIQGINDYYISNFMNVLYTMAKNPKRAKLSKSEIVEQLLKKSNRKNEEINKGLGLYTLIDTLEEILFILRKSNIDSYKKLEKAHKDKKIQELLKKLENIKLSEYLDKDKDKKDPETSSG